MTDSSSHDKSNQQPDRPLEKFLHKLNQLATNLERAERERRREPWSGIDDMDAFLGKPDPGEVIAIAGEECYESSSDFGLSVLVNVALRGTPAAILSIRPNNPRMAEAELAYPFERMIAALSRVNIGKVQGAQELEEIDGHRLNGGRRQLDRAQITRRFVGSDGTPDVQNVTRHIQEITQINPHLGLLVLEHTFGVAMSRNEAQARYYERLMRELKKIAVREQIVVIVLTFYSLRFSDPRENGRPSIADLEPNMSLVSGADRLLLLYHKTRWEQLPLCSDPFRKGELEVIVARNKVGPIGSFLCTYTPTECRVESHISEERMGDRFF